MNRSFLRDLGLLVFRVALSAGMLTHGYPKLQRLFSGNEISFADPLGLGEVPSLILTVLGEFVAPLFIIVGWKTRVAAFWPIAVMAVAAFVSHADDPFSRKEKALLYLIGFLAVVMLGPGKFSVDRK